MTTTTDVSTLATSLRGTLVTPESDDFDEARSVYNGMIDRRPAAVAYCVDTADVITSLVFGREAGLEIAVRGGGHHANGFGVWDDALVIDLSRMNGVDVVPGAGLVRVQGGAVWVMWTTQLTRSARRCPAASSQRPASAV